MCDDVFEDPNDMNSIEESNSWTDAIQTHVDDNNSLPEEWFPEQNKIDPVTYWYLMQPDTGVKPLSETSRKILEEDLGKLFKSLEEAILDNDDERIKELHKLIALTQIGAK